jgi:hypothetical protein
VPKKHFQPAERKPRSDAQQNRERVLEVARAAFTRSGADASLDDIAKQAGVGPGTLKAAIKSGDIRKDLDAFDLLRVLIGVSNIAIGPDWKESARRLVDILIKGSRPMKYSPARIVGGSNGYGWR